MEIELRIDDPEDVTAMPIFEITDSRWDKIVEATLDRLIPGEYAATRTIRCGDEEWEQLGTVRIEGSTQLTWYEHERTD